MARRKRGNAPQQQSGISQAGAPGSYSLQADRATAGNSGNTGEPPINPVQRRRRATAWGSGGAPLNFARRGRKQSAQRPAVSFRQYQGSPLSIAL